MKRVVIVYRFLPQYRREFYCDLRRLLREHGVELVLVYGSGDSADRLKGDLIDLEWGHRIDNHIIELGGKSLYWQPGALRYIRGAQLVIVEQASRLLINYLLQGAQYLGGPKLALWGHGRNFQATRRNAIAERIKRWYSRHPHWWFAYTDHSARIVESLGFPRNRITIVENAIDTSQLRSQLSDTSSSEVEALKAQLDLSSENVGVYVGGLYEQKRLPFLVEAGKRIRARVPDFQMVVAGDGKMRHIIEAAASDYDWIKYAGPRFGREKAAVLSLGKVFLMPGLVGLAILDAFTAGLPMFTTDVPFHSPEIEYLTPGKNGAITRHDVIEYSDSVAEALLNVEQLDKMREAALDTGLKYTMENMVQNFARGILAALER